MEVRLVVEHGQDRRVFPLPEGATTMGRSRRCTIHIPVNSVSRLHSRLHKNAAGFVVVEDLGSANGTRLNGDRITGVHVVRPGDRLKIGPFTFVVEYELIPAALEALRLAELTDRKYLRWDLGEHQPPPHEESEKRTEMET